MPHLPYQMESELTNWKQLESQGRLNLLISRKHSTRKIYNCVLSNLLNPRLPRGQLPPLGNLSQKESDQSHPGNLNKVGGIPFLLNLKSPFLKLSACYAAETYRICQNYHFPSLFGKSLGKTETYLDLLAKFSNFAYISI